MVKHKILLFGGTGTLSTAILRKLIDLGWDIWILNRGLRKKSIPQNVNVIIGDFKNPSSWIEKVSAESFSVVIDFLSRTPEDINRIFPLFQNKCLQYVFISSACVYRKGRYDFPIKETSPKPNVNWSYNVEKYNSEKKLLELATKGSAKYTIVRPYITYDDERIPFGITPAYKYHRTIIERLKAGKPMFVWDGGDVVTTLTYVDDFANGVIGLLLNEKAYDNDFHITGDFKYTWNEFWKILKQELKSKSEIINVSVNNICRVMPQEKGTLMGDRALNAIFDNSKIKAAVPNLHFCCDLQTGLKHIVDYWEHDTRHLYDYKYDALLDRLMRKQSKLTHYYQYPCSKGKDRLLYSVYRYLPFRLAQKICRILKIE